MEPIPKRSKLDNTDSSTESNDHSTTASTYQILSILSDDFSKSAPLENVCASSLTDTKCISEIILQVNKLLPAPSLLHLKRVKKNTIILCPIKHVVDLIKENENFISLERRLSKTIDEIIEQLQDPSLSDSTLINNVLSDYLKFKGFTIEMIETLTSVVGIYQVPSIQPKLRWQFIIASEQWPCKFHLNKHFENLYNNSVFNENEKNFHITLMNLSLSASLNLNGKCVGVAVDSRNGHIVAIGGSRIDLHPLMHCSMVLIDMVSRSQNGGAWNELNVTSDVVENDDLNHNGIDVRLKSLISGKFSVKFGAQNVSNSKLIYRPTDPITSNDNLSKYGPYLCTGYDVYLTEEPCIMCAMALVHSRVRKIFFHKSTTNGALKTLTKLHTIKPLNHHYEVYQCSTFTCG